MNKQYGDWKIQDIKLMNYALIVKWMDVIVDEER
jgi:hypothetical protein